MPMIRLPWERRIAHSSVVRMACTTSRLALSSHDPSHHLQFFHLLGKLLVCEGKQAGVFDGNRRLAGKGGEQVLIVLHERQAVAAVDDFDHAQDPVFDLHGTARRARDKRPVCLSVTPKRAAERWPSFSMTGARSTARPAIPVPAGRRCRAVSRHGARGHTEDQVAGRFIHQEQGAGFAVQDVTGVLQDVPQEGLLLERGGELACDLVESRKLMARCCDSCNRRAFTIAPTV